MSRFERVGLWGTTAEDIERDLSALIERVEKVFISTHSWPNSAVLRRNRQWVVRKAVEYIQTDWKGVRL